MAQPGLMGASARAYRPTLRQRAKGWLTERLGDNREAARLAETLLGGGGADGSRLGVIDVTPAGVPLFLEEAGRKLGAKGRRLEGAADVALAVAPIPMARGAKGLMGSSARKRTASLTAEQVPYVESGYDVAKASPRVRRAYTEAAPWTDSAGQDRLSRAMGYEAEPTQSGFGYWKPPGGKAEINPVEVHRPILDGPISPEDEAAFNFMQAYRGLNDVQAGTPWHLLGEAVDGPAERYSLNLGRQPSPREMQRLNATVEPAGGMVWNAGDGVTLATFDDAAALDRTVRGMLPEAAPRATGAGGYVDLSDSLKAPGQGRAVGQVMEMEGALSPQQRAHTDSPEFQALSRDVGAMRGDRARRFGLEGVRPDFDLLWRLQAEGGWQAVRDFIARNGPRGLPVLAGVAVLSEQQAAPQPTTR